MNKDSIYNQMTRSEKEVADFLRDTGLFWSYEKPVYIWDENNRLRVWTPDFCLIPFGIYVEVCGSESFNYDYRKNVYRKNGYDVIFLHLYKEPTKWKKHLMNYLKLFANYRNHKLNEILGNEN